MRKPVNLKIRKFRFKNHEGTIFKNIVAYTKVLCDMGIVYKAVVAKDMSYIELVTKDPQTDKTRAEIIDRAEKLLAK